MELLIQSPGLFIAIIGWAACSLLVLSSKQYTVIQQRALLIIFWIVWTTPAFNALVYRGLLNSDNAILVGGTLSVVVAAAISLSGVRWNVRRRTRH